MTRNNFILIVTDQQRHDSLGCTGNRYAVTPHLDRLAKDRRTLLFQRHIAANSVCMPSRASLLTGLYPGAHGVWYNGVALPRAGYVPTTTPPIPASHVAGGCCPSHISTLPDLFSENGYHTASVGKIHLTPTGSHPSLGFEESTLRWEQDPGMREWRGPFYGFQNVDLTLGHGEGVGGHYGYWLRENHREAVAAREAARQAPRPFPEVEQLYPGGLTSDVHPTTWIGDRACEYIRGRAGNEQPFFLWVGIPDPHHPFSPPADLASEFETHDTMPVGAGPETLLARPSAYRHLDGWKVPAAAVKRIRQYTDAMNHLIDRQVGKIVQTLRETGQWDNTVLIFTSDHGDWLGEHGLAYKFTVGSESLNHVPLLMRVPASVVADLPRQRRIRAATSHTDILPTLCAFSGMIIPENVHGRGLMERGRTGDDESRPVMVTNYCPRAEHSNFTIYDNRYRLTWFPRTGELELYDHHADPFEVANLAGQAQHGRRVKRMLDRLQQFHCRTNVPVAGRVAMW
jgi:arylsulfatase A-like enzyme